MARCLLHCFSYCCVSYYTVDCNPCLEPSNVNDSILVIPIGSMANTYMS